MAVSTPTAAASTAAPTVSPLHSKHPELSALADVVSVELVLTDEPELDANAYLYKLTYLSDDLPVPDIFPRQKTTWNAPRISCFGIQPRGHSDFGAVPSLAAV